MSKLTKLETLQKAVVDTEAALEAAAAAYAAADTAYGDAHVDYIAAWSAFSKARLDLNNYLKEQDNA